MQPIREKILDAIRYCSKYEHER